jgi:glycosyltransferase involved in cell wall biosynthesis
MHKRKKIRIAMVAPPFGTTGGPEVVVQNLTEALLEKGVDVTLFAPSDWKTNAKHIPTLEKSLWNMKNFKKQKKTIRKNLIAASQAAVLSHQKDFDIVHLHSMGYAFAVGYNLKIPVVLTTHNSPLKSTYNLIRSIKIHLVSISKANKKNLRTDAVIYNGLPVKKVPFSVSQHNKKYLITVGRIAKAKGILESIKIALKAEKKLVIIGRLGTSEERITYYNKYIKPYVDNKNIIHIKKVRHENIYKYLKNAAALLFTPIWEEPFGMVAIEALAAGTPVIGTKSGALKEIVRNPKIGYLSNNKKNLINAIKKIDKFDRRECRKYVEKYFDSSIMADKYIKIYHKLLRIKI